MPRFDKRAALIILDGWGIGPDPSVSAIAQAQTPHMDRYLENYPNAKLQTYGKVVGLPNGQIGNSEVGHMNLGAGRVVYQELTRISKEIQEGNLAKNSTFKSMVEAAKKGNRRIHLLGLVSDGGVHASIEHMCGICDLLVNEDVEVLIHAFTDGRDTPPDSAIEYIETLDHHISGTNARIATIIGRFYAMDRDHRWDRIQKAYNLLVRGIGFHYDNAKQVIQASYDAGIQDEFIEPAIIGTPATIEADDVVFFTNFRTDRPRELTTVLTQKDMPEYHMHKLPLHFVTMTSYDAAYEGIHIVFTKDNMSNTLGETISRAGLTQLRIAETEKYPHVTFFFNCGEEQPYPGESRIVIPSPKVETYDLQPEMSAQEVTDAAMRHIELNHPHFVCLNYANTDMVGHTGNMSAAIQAAETVDSCLGKLVHMLTHHDYNVVILADHGNADVMKYPDGSPHTAHTLSMVPLIVISERKGFTVSDGKLGDIAPTILSLMGVDIPTEMTGDILIDLSTHDVES